VDSAGGASDEGGHDVSGVAVEGLTAAVVAHGCSRIGVTRGLLNVRRGTPASRAAVMKACRSVWGPTRFVLPARRVAGPALEAHRSGLADELRASPYVARFPASLDPSPFPDTRRFRETAPVLRRLPDWWGGSPAPLVYVTFGTVLGHMSMAAKVYRVALRAVAEIHARVLLTVGRHFDVSQLDPIPGNVHVESWVDQAHVFAEAQVVVCHGGSGTTFGALGAGVPVVIVPLFADQFANSPKVTEAGAGIVVERSEDSPRRSLRQDDAAPITEAIKSVLSHSSYRERAHDVAAEPAIGPTADELITELLAS
jgi:UDP:flavonoid glycosyltransferase YjiC (YdhE family)